MVKKGWNDMRCIYVSYGDVSKIQLKPSAKPLDALLYTGFDLYVEVAPKQWVRAVDLPENHPANVNLSAGAYKAGLTDANGQTFTILNAFNPTHRQLAAKEGLYINMPYNPNKREELLKALENIRESLQVLSESRFLELQNRIDKIKTRLEVLKGIRSLEKEIAEREKLQATWDSTVNDAADMLEKVVELSNTIFPTKYEKLAFQEAVKRAKREAALETAIEESLLLNPSLLRGLKQMLLED
jgi:hypothetical protein